MKTYNKIVSLLDRYELNYTTSKHSVTRTSIESAKARNESLSYGAKAMVLKIENDFYLFVLKADMKINTKKVKSYLKSKGKRIKKIRFATSDELMDLTGLESGAVPPFGLPILNLELFLDPALLKNEKISFNAGSLTDSISMNPRAYMKVAKPVIFEFAEKVYN